MTFFRGLVILNIFMLLIVTNYSCAAMFQFNYEVVDDDLKPYVQNYKEHLQTYCKNNKYNTTRRYLITKVNKEDFEKPTWIGVCKKQLNGFTIEIQTEFFENASDEDRQQLINHELSHCMLNKEHVQDVSNYMFETFIQRPKDEYEAQLIKDMKDECK